MTQKNNNRFVLKEDTRELINSSQSLYEVLKPFFTKEREEVYFIGVDSKNKIRLVEVINIGSIDQSMINSNIIFKRCFTNDLNRFFLAHNHPSGDITPSQEDLTITEKINKACSILNVKMLDHIVFSDEDYYSMFDNDKGGF